MCVAYICHEMEWNAYYFRVILLPCVFLNRTFWSLIVLCYVLDVDALPVAHTVALLSIPYRVLSSSSVQSQGTETVAIDCCTILAARTKYWARRIFTPSPQHCSQYRIVITSISSPPLPCIHDRNTMIPSSGDPPVKLLSYLATI